MLVTDIAGHRMSSCHRISGRSRKTNGSLRNDTIPDPASPARVRVEIFDPFIKDECLLFDYLGFVSE